MIGQQRLDEINKTYNQKVKLEGLLVYYKNDFIVQDEMAQPSFKISALGKARTFLEKEMQGERLHGIIVIQGSYDLAYDKQSIVGTELVAQMRDKIFRNYKEGFASEFQERNEKRPRNIQDQNESRERSQIHSGITYSV